MISFTNRNILLICLFCYSPIFYPIFVLLTQDYIIFSGGTCPFQFYSPIVNMKLLVPPIAIAIFLHTQYLLTLKKFLSRSLTEIAVLLNKPVSEIKSKLDRFWNFRNTITVNCSYTGLGLRLRFRVRYI